MISSLDSEELEGSTTLPSSSSLKDRKEQKRRKNKEYYQKNKERLACKRKKQILLGKISVTEDREEKETLEKQLKELELYSKKWKDIKPGRKPLPPEEAVRRIREANLRRYYEKKKQEKL